VKRLWKALFAGDLTPHKGTLIIQPAFRATTSWKIKMTVMQEFKDFAIKGNVVDLAVGVIIGGAFGKIVDSVVSDLIMPIVGAVIGKLDFSNLFIVLGTIPAGTATTLDGLRKAGVPVLAYGSFITIAVNFFILAFIIFMMIKQINRLKRESPAATTTTPAPIAEDIVLLREIRDSLKK
jgi:large conductance mechanosensitive channel